MSKQWAVKLDNPVEDDEYSSKYYAKISEKNAISAKESANLVEGIISDTEKLVVNSLNFPEFKISSEKAVLNKLKFQKHSTFDKSKFTVVGSPTITGNGVVSGFSNSNYLADITNLNNYTTENFEITISCTYGDTYDTNSLILLSDTSASTIERIRIFNGNLTTSVCEFKNTDGTVVASAYINNIYQGQQIWIKLGKNNNGYYVKYSEDGITYLTSKDNIAMDAFNIASLQIGTRYRNRGHYFKGSIDLSQFLITVDGKEVISGNKTGIDTIKTDNYEVVGSPIVSDDGVVSGFSKANYIKLQDLDKSALNWEFRGRFKPITFADTFIFSSAHLGTSQSISIYMNRGGDVHPRVYLDVEGVQTTTGFATIGAKISLNKEYDYCFKRNGDTFTFAIKEVGGTFSKEVTTTYAGNYSLYSGSLEIYNVEGSFEHDLNHYFYYIDDNLVYQTCLKIPYTQSKTGSKIVDDVYRDRVQDLYEQYGYAHYYTLGDENYTLATCKGSDIVAEGEVNGIVYTRTADLTLTQRGSCTNETAVKLLSYKDKNSYQISTSYSEKTKDSFTPSATGDFIAIGKTVLE